MTAETAWADRWYHRGPCCRCSICGRDECWVYNPGGGTDDNIPVTIHFCVNGCDGLPMC